MSWHAGNLSRIVEKYKPNRGDRRRVEALENAGPVRVVRTRERRSGERKTNRRQFAAIPRDERGAARGAALKTARDTTGKNTSGKSRMNTGREQHRSFSGTAL